MRTGSSRPSTIRPITIIIVMLFVLSSSSRRRKGIVGLTVLVMMGGR